MDISALIKSRQWFQERRFLIATSLPNKILNDYNFYGLLSAVMTEVHCTILHAASNVEVLIIR
jgi:hypothetical protein